MPSNVLPLHLKQTFLPIIFTEGDGIELAFPTRPDSATFWDKGTEVSSLSRDKGTMGQAQNLATGRDGIFYRLSRPGTSRDSLSKFRPVPSLGKNLSLSRCPFVPGQLGNFCPFVPKSCTVPSRWKRYLKVALRVRILQ